MRTLFLLLALTLALAVPAVADEVTLDSGKDNTIYESDTGHLSNALGLNLFAGSNGAGGGNRVTRALIAFDLSEIPDGSTIQSAELIIQVDKTRNAGTLQLHKVSQDWGEGTSGASFPGSTGGGGGGDDATTGDATWIHTFSDNTFWTSAGGDFDPIFSDSVAVSGTGSYSFDDAELAVDLQSWLDNPETNFGWLIRQSNESTTAIRFTSFQNGGTLPMLDVAFVPEPGAIGTLAAALTLLILRRGIGRRHIA
jgi:hypothetical protein